MKRKKIDWEKMYENKFNHLLVITIFLFIASPFLLLKDDSGLSSIGHFINMIAFIAILKIIVQKKRRFIAFLSISVLAFSIDVIGSLDALHSIEHALDIIALFIRILFILLFILLLIGKVFSSSQVSRDTIKGGICIYIFMGILWAFIFKFIHLFDPQAFSPEFTKQWNFFYFSFSNLTTVGYGDIVPLSNITMMLSNLEALTGQIFMTVFVARLVGLYIARKTKTH